MPSYFLETLCIKARDQVNLQYGTMILKINTSRLQGMGREAEGVWHPDGHSEYQLCRDTRKATPQAPPQGAKLTLIV